MECLLSIGFETSKKNLVKNLEEFLAMWWPIGIAIPIACQ